MRPRLPLLLLLSASLSAGCGGSSSDPKPAYVEAASEVCTQAGTEFAELTPPTATSQFGPYVQQTVAIAERAQTDLAALTPPPDDRAELESRVLEPFAQLVAEGKAYSARVTAAGTDEAALLALLAERPTADRVDVDLLRRYGLTACADAIGQAG